MDILDQFRRRLISPTFLRTVTEKGWRLHTSESRHELIPGCCYMALALCELTGTVLKGGGVYDPHGRWMRDDLGGEGPRTYTGTGWCFFDIELGALYSDKEVFYYKPVPVWVQQQHFRYPWLMFAPA